MYIERGDIWYSSAIDVIVVVFLLPLFTSTAISHWRVDFLIVLLLLFIATVKRSTKTCKMLLHVLSWPKSWPG